MKYKVGDRVRVKSLEWYNKHKGTWGDVRGRPPFTSQMVGYCGQVKIIQGYSKSTYLLDNSGYRFTDEMLEDSITFPCEMMVWDNDELNANRRLVIACDENYYIAGGAGGCYTAWKHAKPIPEKKTLTLTLVEIAKKYEVDEVIIKQ